MTTAKDAIICPTTSATSIAHEFNRYIEQWHKGDIEEPQQYAIGILLTARNRALSTETPLVDLIVLRWYLHCFKILDEDMNPWDHSLEALDDYLNGQRAATLHDLLNEDWKESDLIAYLLAS